MKKRDKSVPVQDPDQLVVEPVSKDKHYLGNAQVVHRFVGSFAESVIRAYDGFLSGKASGEAVQAEIERLIKEYGDAFMGRDERFEIAPWQGERMRWRILESIGKMDAGYSVDPGEEFFRFLSIQCIKAAVAMARGMPEDVAGAHLKEILDDTRARMLGVIT